MASGGKTSETTGLRARAEARLKGGTGKNRSKLQEADLPRLLHELQVHQIELEMQNEELRQAQAALEQSRDRYVDLYDFAPLAYLTLADTGQIAEINITGAALLGVERNRLHRRRFAQFVAQEDKDRWQQHFLQVLQHGERQQCELAIQRGGSRFHAELDCIRSTKEDGAASVRVILTDITARREADEQLRKSSAEIEDLYNHAPCGYHSLDKNGVILKVNDTELAWLGYTRAEVAGKMKMTDLTTPASGKIFREEFARLMQQGYLHDIECEMLRKDGTVFIALINSTAIYDAGGKYVMSRSTLLDITRRKSAERALALSEERARLAIDGAGLALWDYDLASGKVYLSDMWSQFLGGERQPTFTTIEELFSLVPAEEQTVLRSALLRAVKGDGTSEYHVTHRVRKPDGEYIWIVSEGHVTKRAPNGWALRMTGTNRNISERKKLEAKLLEQRNELDALQKMQVATQTAAAIAHELNQPLLAIASYSDAMLMMLEKEKPDLERMRTIAARTEQQAHRAGEAIRAILASLSMDVFPTEDFDLNSEIVELMGTARAEHDLQFHCVLELEDDLPRVRANRTHVQKVLFNLVRNGVEAMQQAGVPQPFLTVTVHTIKDRNLAQATIRDNGPGFREADIQRLFEPFFTTKPNGIGMGLSISRSLIEANGGQLWVDPQEGPGATFHLTLPFAS
jgi:two-component system, LuxR family, sensor kinase FixL